MDESVKISISSRKDAFYKTFDINDADIKKEIDDLFKEIEAFGKSCKDSLDFENKFASSDLNQKYIDLLTKVGTKCPSINYQNMEYEEEDKKAEFIDDAKRAVRRRVKEEATQKARGLPIIGDAMEVKQNIDLLNRFKKDK